MSIGGKRRSRERRIAEKRAKKRAMTELYQSYRDRGENRKRKLQDSSGPRAYPKGKHPYICGNVGCRKCRPENWVPYVNPLSPHTNLVEVRGMPQRLYLKFRAQFIPVLDRDRTYHVRIVTV